VTSLATPPIGAASRRLLLGPRTAHFCARREQLLQPTFGFDVPILQHQDMVGPMQGGPAVRDDQAGQFAAGGFPARIQGSHRTCSVSTSTALDRSSKICQEANGEVI
jgi:hypothetical protein